MKIVALSLIVLAVVVGVVPQFTDCESQNRSMVLGNGNLVPYKCHWTAMAELGMAGGLAALALAMMRVENAEAKRKLSIVGIALGALVVLLPTYLIGVEPSAAFLCNSVMRQTLVASGALVMAICAASMFNVLMTGDNPQTSD
jgi:hypothetical protein